MAQMDLKSFHDEDISCTLCENRRGINSTCCCPEDAKNLVLIKEEKFRRRIGLEPYQKLCPTHASKLKNGLLFGGSSVFECCAPFHVNTARSPGLRSVPHSWKEYFPSPNQNDVRYRPRQRICWDCYAVALEVINAEQLDSSDDESSSGVKSLPACLGYVSPRRWASNLQLFPTSPHGSQFGSAWSLTPHVTSPKSATLREAQHYDKEFGDARLWRDRMNARSATLPMHSMDMKGVDSVGQSPLSPNEVFTTTWSLDPNHNVTCLIDVSSDQAESPMQFDDEGTAIRASLDLASSAEDMRHVSTDQQMASSSETPVATMEKAERVKSHALIASIITSPPLVDDSEGTPVDDDTGDSVDISPGDSVDIAAGDSVDISPGDSVDIAAGDSVDVLIDQKASGKADADSSSGQSSDSDWVLVQSSGIEGNMQPSCTSSQLPMSSTIHESIADDNRLHPERNSIPEFDHVTSNHETTIENQDNVIDHEAIMEDKSFRFDPIIAANPEDNHKIDDDPENMRLDSIPEIIEESSNICHLQSSPPIFNALDDDVTRDTHSENMRLKSVSEIIEKSSNVCDLQSTLPIITTSDDDVTRETQSDVTDEVSIGVVDDEITDKISDMAHSALNYDTDDNSSSDEDFGLRPIAEETSNAVNMSTSKTNQTQSSCDSIVEIRTNNESNTSRISADSKQKDVDANIQREIIDDTHDRTNKKSLGEVCIDGELPPLSYMHERRKVKLDQITPEGRPSMIDVEYDATLQTTTLSENQSEQPEASGSTTKTYLYKHLHGSKDSAACSSASDQECEPVGCEGQVTVSNQSTHPDSLIDYDNTNDGELQHTDRTSEHENVQQLRRRAKNNRAHSVDVDTASANRQNGPKRTSTQSDGIIANRKTAVKDKKRKVAVTFALPITEDDTFMLTERSERKKNAPLERASTEIVESHRDSRTLGRGASLEDEILTRPKTLRESRRISNKERLSTLQNAKDAVADEGNKPDQSEDEDVSAILSDIISNVFTRKALTDWARSFGEGSVPIIFIAGVSITAAISLSLIAFLALR